MLLQVGTLILYLLTTQVTDTLGQTANQSMANNVSVLTDKLDALGGKVDLVLTKVSEKILNSPLSQSTCLKGKPHRNGIKRFTLWGSTTALCDTITDEGGWVIIQRRINGDTYFYNRWSEYKNFFGNLDTNFWFGNDAINRLSSEGYNELRVEIVYNDRLYYAHYSEFYVASEGMKYRLTVSGYSGTAGDSLGFHNGMYFSTYDRDNDRYSGNLAVLYSGAWWYKDTYHSNLNGMWGSRSNEGTIWYATTGWQHPVSFTKMMVRRG